jgi:hypothetical protein
VGHVSRVLRVEQLEIKDRRGWQKPYDLDARLVGIIGPIDRGKTSMVDCIDYVFGRSVRFRGAVYMHLLAARARIRIGDGTFVLRRDRSRASRVHVWDAAGDPVGKFPVKASEGEQSLSDWLLAQLELDDTFASVRLPGNRSLEFATDLLPYLHVRQEDIDRFVIRPDSADTARMIVLKLLLHLTSPQLQRLLGSMRDTENEIRRKKEKARDIEEFLSSSPATNAETLDEDLARLREKETEAAARLARLRDQARSVTGFAAHVREKVEQARKRLSTAEEAADWARNKRRQAQSKVDALNESLHALTDLEETIPDNRNRLSLEYASCPACERELGDRVVSSGHCSLCTLPLQGSSHPRERKRPTEALEKAKLALAETERDFSSTEQAVENARDHLCSTDRQRA